MRAISSINLLKNRILVEQAQELVKIMQAKEKLITLCGLSKEETELDFSNQGLNAGDAVLIANDISDMGAMTKLDASNNSDMFSDKTGITDWAAALKASISITELNLARNGMGANDTNILAPAISDMRALTKFDISGNYLRARGGMALAAGLKGNQVITELNIGSNKLGLNSNNSADTSGVVAIADVICDMGAILSVNLLTNDIPFEQAKALASILKEHPTLKSLYGNRGDETELDMRGKGMGAGDAIMLVPEIVDNKALTHLDVSSNNLGEVVLATGWKSVEHPRSGKTMYYNEGVKKAKGQFTPPPGCRPLGIIALAGAIRDNGALTALSLQSNSLFAAGGKALAEGLKDNQVITELNISSNRLGYKTFANPDGTDLSGVIALADAIRDMRALTSLNLSSNNVGGADQGIEDKFEQAQKDVEVLLQSFGTGIEALQTHFEKIPQKMIPEDDSAAVIISMVSTQRFEHLLSLQGPYQLPHTFFEQIVAALEKAEIDIPADTKAKLSACFAQLGVIALADAIKNMGAMSLLNLSANKLGPEGVLILCEGLLNDARSDTQQTYISL
jgi:Ran GTPase-activating protein (RanGAP) involved in mRNA processing and transport